MRLKVHTFIFLGCLVAVAVSFPPFLSAAPAIGPIHTVTPGDLPLFHKFEIGFAITNTALPYPASFPVSGELNPYFPYDGHPPTGIGAGTGISVNVLFLPPGQSVWKNAPCFFYQPVEEVGTGANIALLPIGSPEWRCRLIPDQSGVWQYKIQAQEQGGSAESPAASFTATGCSDPADRRCKGFLRVSSQDPRFFEYSNGEPFIAPLVNQEQGSPFNSLAAIRTNVARLGQNGVRFNRWFPTGEGANYFIIPYGDWIRPNWAFGDARENFEIVNTDLGKKVSFRPYYYSIQAVPVKAGNYRLRINAYVEGEQVIRMQAGNRSLDICSATSTFHESQGGTCQNKQSGWHEYILTYSSGSNTTIGVGARGLYISTDAPTPFNQTQAGNIRTDSMIFQRDETGSNGWGSNLLTRSDPNTHTYIDQRSAARLDEILKLSEENGVYHKLTVFHKNDNILNYLQPDGTFGDWYQCDWGMCPNNFYSADGQAARWYEDAYVRYFLGRWGYSTAIHSLELGNECDLYAASYDAGWHFANLVKENSPRPLMVTNSFWGYYADDFFNDPSHENLINYDDKHWYTNASQTVPEVISNTWEDSAAYVRECFHRFQDYREMQSNPRPIVRGEGGVSQSGTEPQHPDIARETTGTWYHKKLWAHTGILGYTCDGDWYPRLFESGGQFPNDSYSVFQFFLAYENFMQGENVNNGHFTEIGTDFSSTDTNHYLSSTNPDLRAFGVKDTVTSRTLLWIDNGQHTWKKMADGQIIAPVTGDLRIDNLANGNYLLEWWNTATGILSQTENQTVTGNQLTVHITQLATDTALKIINPGVTPTPSPHPAIPGDIDQDNDVDIFDYNLLVQDFGLTNDSSTPADLDQDNDVDIFDYNVLVQNFGQTG